MDFLLSHIGSFALVIICLLSWILVRVTGVNYSRLTTDGNNQSFVLRYPKKLIGVSLLIMAAGIAIIAFMENGTENADRTVMYITDAVIALMFIWLFVFIMLKIYHFRVAVSSGNTITVYPSVGKPYTFTTSDIASVKHKLNSAVNSTDSYVITTKGGKKFRVASTMISYNEFQKLLFRDCSSIIR